MANAESRKPFIFSIHIYKTAGSSLLSFYDRNIPRNKACYANIKGLKSTQEELENKKIEIANLGLLHGHFTNSWKRFIPNDIPTKTIVFLREPVSRLKSDYLYNKHFSGGHHYDQARSSSFNEYINNNNLWDLDNGMLRFVAGLEHVPFGMLNSDHLKIGLELLDRDDWIIGITEYFENSILNIQNKLALRSNLFIHKNKTNRINYQLGQLDDDLIHERVKWDKLLYEKALDKFKKQLQEQNIGKYTNKAHILKLKAFHAIRNLYYTLNN